jgi:hypothetical protein
MRYALLSSLVVGSAAFAIVACGSAKNNSFDPNGGDGSSGGGGASSGTPPGSIGSSGGSSSGTGTTTCAADVVAATRAEVDIIVVIDTSGSMSEETASVNSNINAFASSIGKSGLDYRVIMIADKPPPFVPPGFPIPGVCVPPPLGGAACADNAPLFHQIATTVDSNDSLQLILDQYSTYEPWLRPTAFKVFIEITDDNSSPLQWTDFDTKILAKSSAHFGDATTRRYIFDSICGWKKSTPVLSATKCDSAVNTGDQYQQLSKLTGGIVDSVCETDYSGVFSNIAKGLVTKLGCEFAVPKPKDGSPADPTKVVVNYTPGGGATKPLTQVTDASKCGTIPDAWYYDNPSAPTKILFCPTTCAGAGSDTNGKLEIALGCAAPPPK